MSKREFKTIQEKATYSLPIYTLDNSGLVKTDKDFDIKFLKGDRNNEGTFRQDGILTESVISMLIEHLTNVNKDVPSRETSVAITKLQEALFWLEERQRDREARNVAGTYQK